MILSKYLFKDYNDNVNLYSTSLLLLNQNETEVSHFFWKSILRFFSAPASHTLLGERQTYRAENALPKALTKKRKAQTDHEKNAKY